MSTSVAVPSAPMLPDGLEFHTRHLGHLPLIRALTTKLGVDAVLNERFPKDPRNRVSDADCVATMILNILSGRCALYSMPEFFQHVDTDVVLGTNCPPDALNDVAVQRSGEDLSRWRGYAARATAWWRSRYAMGVSSAAVLPK